MTIASIERIQRIEATARRADRLDDYRREMGKAQRLRMERNKALGVVSEPAKAEAHPPVRQRRAKPWMLD